MMDFAYGIRNWREHFETAESRKIKGPLSWVAVPTKHDGRGYRRAIRAKHQVEALCGWWSLLQVAAKMPVHGLLADRDGPLAAEDIADKTGLPTKIYITALSVMSDAQIGWLEQLPWDKNLDFAGNLAALVASQRIPADALAHQRTPADTSGHQRTKKGACLPGNTSGHQRTLASNGADQHLPADSGGHQRTPADARVQTGHNITDRQYPLPSPEGGHSAGNRISNPEIAKRLICEKILGGKDPARQWSYQAQERLAGLCGNGGLPLQEIEDIATYRSIEKSDDIPELKARRDPITETSLMEYWGDELTRAQAYLKKYRVGRNGAAEKKEPADWQEFFRWKYGTDCELPVSFWKLEEDQQKEWDREHEEFERKSPAPANQNAKTSAATLET